jgi:hypothetical protein
VPWRVHQPAEADVPLKDSSVCVFRKPTLWTALAALLVGDVFFSLCIFLTYSSKFAVETEQVIANGLSKRVPGGGLHSNSFYVTTQYPDRLAIRYEVFPVNLSTVLQSVLGDAAAAFLIWLPVFCTTATGCAYLLNKTMHQVQRRAVWQNKSTTLGFFTCLIATCLFIGSGLAYSSSQIIASIWQRTFVLGAQRHMDRLWDGNDTSAYPLWIAWSKRVAFTTQWLIFAAFALFTLAAIITLWTRAVRAAAKRATPGICLVCSYPMPAGRCPECGNDDPARIDPFSRLADNPIRFFIKPVVLTILGLTMLLIGTTYPFLEGLCVRYF